MTQRREQTVRLAEVLGIEFEASIGTVELMDLCIAECEGRGSNWGQEPDESEEPPEGLRPALRSLPAPEEAGSSGSSASAGGAPKRVNPWAGGNGARKLREARVRQEHEERVIEQLREVEGAGADAESEAEHAQVVEPAVASSRTSARRGPRRVERREARKAS